MTTLTADTDRIKEYNERSRPQKRVKKTRQKETILKVLRNTTSHPTAAWIYDEVRKELPNISLGTVYRNLRLLAARREISEFEIAGLSRYDANTNNHYHGRCNRCGQIINIDVSAGKILERETIQKTDFTISEYRLEFHGLCKKCRAK